MPRFPEHLDMIQSIARRNNAGARIHQVSEHPYLYEAAYQRFLTLARALNSCFQWLSVQCLTHWGVSRNSALAPKIGIFWVLKQDCFCHTFSQSAISRFSWISWVDWWHTNSQQCSEPRPQTAPAKATGGWQDYHDFEVPLLTILLVLASQALTDCATKTVFFQTSKYTYFGGRCGRCGRCGVLWHRSVRYTAHIGYAKGCLMYLDTYNENNIQNLFFFQCFLPDFILTVRCWFHPMLLILLCLRHHRSSSQHDQGPAWRRHAEIDAVCWVLIFSSVCVLVAIRSSLPDISVPIMPITDFVFRDMKKFGDRPALVSECHLIFVQRRPAVYLFI